MMPASTTVILSLLTSTAALAEPRNRPAERIEPGLLHLRRVDAFLEFESSFEQFRVRSKNGSGESNARQTNRSAITQGLLNLSFSGDVVHPYLIDYYGSVGIGFTESRFHEERSTSEDSDKASGLLSEFDLRADLFRTKPISGTIYGQRGEDRIGRLFLPSLRVRRTAYGTSWHYRDDVFPMQFDYDYVDTRRTGNRQRLDDEHLIDESFRYRVDWNISAHEKLTLDYQHHDTKQEFQGSDFNLERRRDQVRIDYDLAFGKSHEHRFVTLLRVQEESGDLARDVVEFGPQLILQHTPNLSTRYEYQFTRERLGALRVDLHRADFELRHQFLKNLTTTLNVFGLEERTDDDVETTQGGASLTWHYTRNNPYGVLTAELRLAGDSERTRGGSGLRLALNESGTFRDPLPLYLIKANVATASIIVTDATGGIAYRAGTDYTISTIRGRTALLRVPSGRIVNGETVLIDYAYQTPHGGTIDTTRFDFQIQQAFASGLTPYYRFSYRDQDVDQSTGFNFVEDRTDHHRVGAIYTESNRSLSGEYEIFDDAIDPYDALHFTGNLQAIRTERRTLDVRGGFSQYFFEGGREEREVSEINLGAHHEYRIDEHWTTALDSTYRWEDDSIRGTTNALDIEGTLAYHQAGLMVEFTLEYDLLRIAGSKEDGLAAWLNVRRDIENVFKLD
jgi:hypothetical protein